MVLLFFLVGVLFYPKSSRAEGEIEISSWTELQSIGNDESYPCSGSYVLTRDLTSSDADYAAVASADADFQPICAAADFIGSFDGQNHRIYDLVIHTSETAALFSDIEGATIKNLFLVNIDVWGDAYYIGGLVTRATDSTIENVHVSGVVTNSDVMRECTGGIIGSVEASTTIFRSSSTADVSGFNSVGGILGCSNKGAYYSEGATISQSFSSGEIISTENQVGGLVGFGYATVIADSYSTANVTAEGTDVGGLAGILLTADVDEMTYDSYIYNSYATGTVRAYDYVGGLVGEFSGSSTEEDAAIYDSFSTGQVIATGEYAAANGGLVGYLANNESSSIWNSYWYDGYSYTEDFGCYRVGEGGIGNDGCTAVTDLSEFTDEAVLSEIAAAWDFEGEDAVWKTVTNDYPVLFWQSDAAEEDPTPTPTPDTDSSTHHPASSSSGHPAPTAPSCSASAPVGTPDLFQIDVTANTAKLFFTPIDANEFFISFSENPSAEEHGEQVTLSREGVQSHTVYHLKSHTDYYLKVRGSNDCMPGNWSNIMKIRTQTAGGVSLPFYKNSFSAKPVITEKSPTLVVTASPHTTPTESVIVPTAAPTSAPTQPESSDTDSQQKCFLWWCW